MNVKCVSIALTALASLLAMYVTTGCAKDPCVYEQELPRIHPENPYFFTCKGRPYFESRTGGGTYGLIKVPGIDPANLHVRPYRFADDGQQLFYVAITPVGFSEMKLDLQPIPGVDLRTVEILGDYEVMDGTHHYLIYGDSVLVEPRER